ncbi:MAG: tyrosine-type recombinase/integrase [Alphaproteobacteria bacterium]|nr:tyrosine-type recombinase/integrase [Alphaproteobacteria bacterium]
MSTVRLTESRVEALGPRRSPYDIRDAELKGFGVRVLPSGARRFFIHSQHEGRRIWKTVGDAGCLGLGEARLRAKELLAAIRRDETPAPPEERLFEVVAEEVFARYGRHWKPGTRKVNRNYLRSTILPWFAGRNISDIDRQDVQRWVASLHATPVAADRSVPILSVIMGQAELYGYRPEGSNPCTGIRRYRRKGRERFLSEPELHRLALVLDSHEARYPRETAFVRLLLLTGCRKNEIRTLQWSDYRERRLFLRDGKTGPRTVWLSSPARHVLDGLPRRGRWVFPSPRIAGPVSSTFLEDFWFRVRQRAGIDDARLHDCRHTYASIAIMAGESVTTTARLLGHNDAQTTLKYAHLSDRSVREASDALADLLGS